MFSNRPIIFDVQFRQVVFNETVPEFLIIFARRGKRKRGGRRRRRRGGRRRLEPMTNGQIGQTKGNNNKIQSRDPFVSVNNKSVLVLNSSTPCLFTLSRARFNFFFSRSLSFVLNFRCFHFCNIILINKSIPWNWHSPKTQPFHFLRVSRQ